MTLRLVATLLLIFMAAPLHAADDRSVTVGGTVSASNMDSSTDVAVSGSFGFRFTRVAGLELEATVVPSVRSSADGGLIFGGRFPDSRVVILSNNVRIEVPTTSNRLTPYFVAGGGIASFRQTFDFAYAIPTIVTLTPTPPVGLLPPIPQRIETATTELALTLGGGLGIRAASHLFIDADLRLIRLMGDQDHNMGRFGVGVRYAF